MLGLVGLFVVGWVALASAQEPGRVRAQGVPLGDPGVSPLAPAASLRDHREDMRKFVESIAAFARGHRKDFIVIAKGGLDLLSKPEDGDETRQAPARTYTRILDGLMVEGLLAGDREIGRAPEEEKRTAMLARIEYAKRARLRLLGVDYAVEPGLVDKTYGESAKLGMVPFVAHAMGGDLNAPPPYPKIPFRENPKSVLTLGDVENFLWLIDSSPYGREDVFAMKMHENNYDMLIVDVFHGLSPLTRQAVETLKYKRLGAKRLVLAHVDIGRAASHLYYWRPGWREGSPGWVGAPVAGNPDQYWVEYWHPEWQAIILGSEDSYIYGLIAQGFDGVVLDGLDAYRFFEGSLRDDQE